MICGLLDIASTLRLVEGKEIRYRLLATKPDGRGGQREKCQCRRLRELNWVIYVLMIRNIIGNDVGLTIPRKVCWHVFLLRPIRFTSNQVKSTYPI